MPEWIPEPIWKGEDVFIIGGGSSLRNFDWSLLKKEHTIGCNQAFRLGPEVCDICIFCDMKFLYRHNNPRRGFFDELAKFPNPVVTNHNQLLKRKIPWLKSIPRKVKGMGKTSLGYNRNTGSAAINLALIMGAKNVFLLGFDMHRDEKDRPNWHDKLIDKPSDDLYPVMCKAFENVKKDITTIFPDSQIFNITKKSNLNTFQKIDSDIFWAERKNHV